MADEYYHFISEIHNKLGINLSLYKETQMRRRITTLRKKRGFTSFEAYYDALMNDIGLLNEFIDRLTINVSEFYRNPKRWEVLRNTIFPLLLEKNRNLSIWSAACSTGEEPYSIAMMIREYFPEANVKIVATDLDENVLFRAEEGIYLEQALKDLPREFVHKYFTKVHNVYHIDPSLKENITYKKHNLLADPYPINMDLIVCRNVLIYFTDEAKELIYQNFRNTLKKNGVLFVGSTEQIFNPSSYDLRLIDTFFYQKQE
ncbi:CheR family methyltransferase [Oceanobacillus salinisoli]|uniref:CheR family methyltransferase n=1 Tax=Oceanobacillus salinisoli TaxID=2678611 RepID=UPI0012E105CA|nr:protein-glutamate O-methyltransferase CheR [Oceanobacillus salinisoli]